MPYKIRIHGDSQSLVAAIDSLIIRDRETHKKWQTFASNSEALNMHSCAHRVKVTRLYAAHALQTRIITVFIQCTTQCTTQRGGILKEVHHCLFFRFHYQPAAGIVDRRLGSVCTKELDWAKEVHKKIYSLV